MLTDPHKGITRRCRRSSEAFMGSEKPDDRGELVGILRDEGGWLCGFGAHVRSYLNYPKGNSERSNNTAKLRRTTPPALNAQDCRRRASRVSRDHRGTTRYARC